MRIDSSKTVGVSLALSAVAVLGLPAFADEGHLPDDGPGVKTYESDFDFDLFESEPGGGDSSFDLNDRFFEGNDAVPLPQFDPSYGTLNKVKLMAGMAIEGSLVVYTDIQLLAFDAGDESYYDGYVEGGYPTLEFAGLVASGPLSDAIEFGDYEVGVDGAIFDELLEISESGSGFDMTGDADPLDGFIGDGDVGVDLYASVLVDYDTSELGRPSEEGLNANGWVSLTYEFTPATPIVPTPGAAIGGLALMLGLISRRGRR